MFGYVNIYKDELKIKEFNLFKSYYCGLCKALGKRFNQLTRLGLNYDFTFLSILLDSMTEDEPCFSREGCIKNLSKKNIVDNNSSVNYSADMSIILTYYKLSDDIKDDKSIKALFAIIPYYFAVRRLKSKYYNLIESIKSNLKELSTIENEAKCDILDMAAHPFASIMGDIFSSRCTWAYKIGYNIGRFVYMADACDDMDKDFKTKKYNVFNKVYKYDGINNIDIIKEKIKDSIYLTLSAISYEYEALPKYRNKEILDNIIYLGIRAKTDYVVNKIGTNAKNRKEDLINE